MHGSDPQADNLFSRLFSYSPREKRKPIEDYCTEALAWCLRQSPTFALELLKLMKKGGLPLGDEKLPLEIHAPLNVHTQNSFRGGRFDLVIESSNPNFVVAIESKIDSGFREDQLPNYKNQLKSKNFKDISDENLYLVTLTPTGTEKADASANIKWSDVQALLEQVSKSEPSLHVPETMKQFAYFLKERGLAPLELMNITPELLSQCLTAYKLDANLQKLVSRLRNEDKLRKAIGQNRVKNHNDGRIGIFGNIGFFGFGIAQVGKAWELFVLIEICFEGEPLEPRKSVPEDLIEQFKSAEKHINALPIDNDYVNFNNPSGDDTYYAFSKKVEPQLFSQGSVIYDALYDTSQAAINFYNQNKAGSKTTRRK